MIYLVFETKAEADAGQEKIASNMGLGADITKQYAIPARTADDRWCFLKPDDGYMTGVAGCTEEEFSADWLPVQDMNG
jgi:hypothetical protein